MEQTVTEIHKFTANDPKIVPNNLCLGNVSKYFSVSNMNFSVDYDSIDVDDILDIHKYLMKKNNLV